MTIFCSSLRRSDTGWIQVFILSLTQSDKSSSRGRISVKFIISRQLPLVFRRRVLSSNLLYGKSSPNSSDSRNEIKYVKIIDTAKLRKKIDTLSAELRKTDLKIQETNWTADLMDTDIQDIGSRGD